MVGRTILHYRVIEQIGAGGMGVVYKAFDTKLKRTVALKFLPPSVSDQVQRERLVSEAHAVSSLDHQNICTIFDINEHDGQLFLAMAFYPGRTLRELLGRGPLEVGQAVSIAMQLGEGLAHAHARDVIHRDIKPANLMVTADGAVKILDFGIAKMLASDPGLTATGVTVGTLQYMSPEQATGQIADHRSDIWAMGVVLYF
jgi:serine/threonine protein kinase